MNEEESYEVTFVALNPDFKFKITRRRKQFLLIRGVLVYNNGSSVHIPPSYMGLVNQSLNVNPQNKGKAVFSIDTKIQALCFTVKVSNISQQNQLKYLQAIEGELVRRKRVLINLLGVIGIAMDHERSLMKKLYAFKRELKLGVAGVLERFGKLQDEKYFSELKQEFGKKSNLGLAVRLSRPEGGVIEYGGSTGVSLEQQMEKEVEGEKTKSKKTEGGYFSIEHGKYILLYKDEETAEEKKVHLPLVRKTLKENRKQEGERQINLLKMEKELKIVEAIKDKTYLLKYYRDKQQGNNIDSVLLQGFEQSLTDYIYYMGDSLEVQHKIGIAQHIVKAVASLHQSGIVHRDIKPSNFLLADEVGSFRVKVIDFAESYWEKDTLPPEDLACSHPYSPLECSGPDKKLKEGISNKAIDYWSVGYTIYELFFRKQPLSFSRAFFRDIESSWKKELLLAVNQREKHGLNLVDDVITVIAIKVLKCDQKQRIGLALTLQILEVLERYVNAILNIVGGYH